jgi:hypothetical protein
MGSEYQHDEEAAQTKLPCYAGGNALRASSPQGLDISCDILSGGAAERQIRHLGVRIEQEIRQPLGVEIWRPRNRYERRRVGVSTGLIGRHYMTGGAPPFGKIAAMLGIGCVTSRRSNKEGACGKC